MLNKCNVNGGMGGEAPDHIIDSASPANDRIFNALNSNFYFFLV